MSKPNFASWQTEICNESYAQISAGNRMSNCEKQNIYLSIKFVEVYGEEKMVSFVINL